MYNNICYTKVLNWFIDNSMFFQRLFFFLYDLIFKFNLILINTSLEDNKELFMKKNTDFQFLLKIGPFWQVCNFFF